MFHTSHVSSLVRSTRSVFAGILLAASTAAGQTADPVTEAPPRRVLPTNEFGRFSLGISGGFQTWSLDGLERTLSDRATHLAQDGFQFEPGAFGLTFSYGLDVQWRLARHWYAHAQFEWTRLSFEDRDRSLLIALGSRDRTPISIGYVSRVATRPLLVSLGGGHSREFHSVRIGGSAKMIIAPLAVEDDLTIFLDSEFESTVRSTGTGLGCEVTASLDYFTQTRTTLFVETFGRVGSTKVSLGERYWESTILPGSRRVDFSGFGIRMGMRWI